VLGVQRGERRAAYPSGWTGLDTVDGMAKATYDRREQLRQIESGLLPGEEVIAVYDAVGAGTGFIGLTNRRVIVQDKSFVGKKVAITSIPYAKITSVSVVSNKSWGGSFFSTGAIAIHVGTHTYEVEFRGDQKSHHVHNVILHYIS
jgi:hypothetical protein